MRRTWLAGRRAVAALASRRARRASRLLRWSSTIARGNPPWGNIKNVSHFTYIYNSSSQCLVVWICYLLLKKHSLSLTLTTRGRGEIMVTNIKKTVNCMIIPEEKAKICHSHFSFMFFLVHKGRCHSAFSAFEVTGTNMYTRNYKRNHKFYQSWNL